MPKYEIIIPASPPSAPKEAELLQGTLDLLILKIVALEPLHGYGIVQRLQQISKDALQVRQGSLYPALYRMERRGLLVPEWCTHESGREAKYYKLTKEGHKALAKQTEDWRRLRGVMDLILDGEPT
ncbi:MAG: PadR family transcriptional regulator [Acidobacteriota bacterium]